MHALTLWQPYASLVILGFKPYEFRSWNERARFAPRGIVGQRIAIHAAKRRVRLEDLQDVLDCPSDCCHGGTREQWARAEALARDVLQGKIKLPLGAVLGTAKLGKPVKEDGWSQYGWPMLDVEAFDDPIPATGAQGFWIWDEKLAA